MNSIDKHITEFNKCLQQNCCWVLSEKDRKGIINGFKKALTKHREEAREEQKETTKVKDFGKDECYCRWYKCESCGDEMITEDSKFCPNCGRKIIRNQPK